jgi:hypothetical protein
MRQARGWLFPAGHRDALPRRGEVISTVGRKDKHFLSSGADALCGVCQRMRPIAVLCVLLCLPGALVAQTLICGRAATPPIVDARADDPCWSEAMVATDFSVLGSAGAERAFYQTTVRTAWDERALYLHVICLEPDPGAITAKTTDRDGPVWLEDAVEVFLQPDTGRSDCFQFAVNARGTLYDAHDGSASFDTKADVRATIGEQAWQVEMAIRWADLGVPAPRSGDAWGFNVGRERRPADPQEWSTWAALAKGVKRFAQPALFGRLQFSGAAEQGRVSGYATPEGLVTNPDFSHQAAGGPVGWGRSKGTEVREIAPMSRQYAVRNAADYGVVSQSLNLPAKEGEVFTVYAVARASADATIGVAVVQDMEPGSYSLLTRDMYPFWKIGASEQFKLYTGRIVTNKGVKRLLSVNLYRATRTGWVEYAYIQVLPGMHGVAGIAEADRCTRSDTRGMGEPWPSAAVPMYKPLAGGPLKTLVFVGEFQRDVVELSQRLDLDYDLVYCPTYRGSGKVDGVVAFGAERILRRLASGEYGLIVLAGRPSDGSLVQAILDAVAGGAGLVAIEPLSGGAAAKPEVLDRLLSQLPTAPLPAERIGEVLGALSPEVLTQTSGGEVAAKALATAEAGKGRMVRLTWSQGVAGLIPFAPGTGEWWEYRWAALAKAALWAVRRQPESRITAVNCGTELNAQVRARQTGPLNVTVQWDGRFGRLGEAKLTAEVKDGAAEVRAPVPSELLRTKGPAVARVLLADAAGNALDMAACVIEGTRPRAEITEVAVPGEAQPGERVTVQVTCKAAEGTVLRAELMDAYCRLVSRSEAAVTAEGEQKHALTLEVRAPLSVYHRVVVSAVDGGAVADRVERNLLVPGANASHLQDFRLASGYAAMQVRCPTYLQDELVAFLRSLGITACTVNEYMIQRGMPSFGGTAGGTMAYRDAVSVRTPCFSDPAAVERLAEQTVAGIGKKRAWGYVGYNMHDEVHLSQQGNAEVCTCQLCTAAFRDWARETYGTIDATNAEWGTRYAGFEDVTVPLIPEMKGAQNPARWVDFRLLMERVWARAYEASHAAVRAAFPDVALSFTNPYCYHSLSGTDFSLWTPNEELMLRYFHRHVVDRCKSWSHAPMLSWFGYEETAPQNRHFLWWFALNGGVMPIWWDPVEPWAYTGKEGFTPWYLADPLWRPTGRSAAVQDAAASLQAGIGKVLREASPAPAEAAILHSQASMHVLYAAEAMGAGRLTSAGYDVYRDSDDALAAALKRRAYAYRYVLPDRLTETDLAGIKLLALPSCAALSDETVAALRAFVKRGGKLLADAIPATHDGHGKPRGESPLADLFAAGGGACLGAPAGKDSGPALDEALNKLGVAPAISWRTATGALPTATELYAFRLGDAEFLGIVRQPTEEAAKEGALTIDLGAPKLAYDCRTGEALGQTSQLTVEVSAGDARFLALLPQPPGALTLTAAADGRALTVTAALGTTDRVLRVEVTPPGATAPAVWYSQNALARGGRLTLQVPLALNDPVGRWQVTVRDVATGQTAEATAG